MVSAPHDFDSRFCVSFLSLCLAFAEMTMMFEVEDLAVASPATVRIN
jgi:hypothetical protein